mmetsp:Transcript_50257/g.116675  ORF Transcript_50257/g.116675 Transcript_50257/m.116675 type:complete len:377 (-) Transcript_50257:83-1213(-)
MDDLQEGVSPAGQRAAAIPEVAGEGAGEARDAPERDLARGRPTDASSSKSVQRASGLAVDGLTNTRWTSAYADGQWIAVDLGVPYTLQRVEIRWEFAHASSYRIEGSNQDDPMSWTTMASEVGREGLVVTLLPAGSEARWVRMFGERRATNYGFSIWAFRVFADPSVPQPEPPPRPRASMPMPPLIPIFATNFRYLAQREHGGLEPGFQRVLRRAAQRRQRGGAAEPEDTQDDGTDTPAVDASQSNPVVPDCPVPTPSMPSDGRANDEPMPAPAASPVPEAGPLARLASRLLCPSRRTTKPLPPPKLEMPLNGPYVPPRTLEHLLGENPCSICFELLRGTSITITACGHVFHERCLRMADNSQCPQCRQSRVELTG